MITRDDMYRYFVSYVRTGNTFGFGNTEVCMPQPITTWNQVVGVGNLIARNGGMPAGSVIVLNYQLLSGPDTPAQASR